MVVAQARRRSKLREEQLKGASPRVRKVAEQDYKDRRNPPRRSRTAGESITERAEKGALTVQVGGRITQFAPARPKRRWWHCGVTSRRALISSGKGQRNCRITQAHQIRTLGQKRAPNRRHLRSQSRCFESKGRSPARNQGEISATRAELRIIGEGGSAARWTRLIAASQKLEAASKQQKLGGKAEGSYGRNARRLEPELLQSL